MEDDMPFVEGSFRLPNGAWQVVIVSRDDVIEPEVVLHIWGSGVSGVVIRFPKDRKLDGDAVQRLLSETMDVTEWVVVCGPDSIHLR